MKIVRIDHVAVAVSDLSAIMRVLELFGLTVGSTEDLADQGVRSTMISAGNTQIELIESIAEGSTVEKFLAQRGPGLHHICVEVDDLQQAIAVLQRQQMTLVDDEPRSDAAGRRVFLHPKSSDGLLLGIMERYQGAQKGSAAK